MDIHLYIYIIYIYIYTHTYIYIYIYILETSHEAQSMQNEPARARQAVERLSVGAIVDKKSLEEGRSSQPGRGKSLEEG